MQYGKTDRATRINTCNLRNDHSNIHSNIHLICERIMSCSKPAGNEDGHRRERLYSSSACSLQSVSAIALVLFVEAVHQNHQVDRWPNNGTSHAYPVSKRGPQWGIVVLQLPELAQIRFSPSNLISRSINWYTCSRHL